MKFSHSKLTNRYLFVSLIVCIASLAMVYFITVYVLKDSIREDSEYRIQLMAKTLAKQTNIRYEQIVQEVRMVSGYFQPDNAMNKEMYVEEMKNLVLRNPLYLQLRVFDRNGELFMSVPEVDIPPPPNFNEILDRISWSKTAYTSDLLTLEDGREIITISYPALNNEGEFIGGVMAYVNLNILSQFLGQVKIGEEGMNALVDRNGRILAHSNNEFIGGNIQGSQLNALIKRSQIDMWEGLLFGKWVILSFYPTVIDGIGIVVGETLDQVLVPVIHVQTILFRSFMFVLIITVIFTIIGTNRVIQPINELIRQAKEYKKKRISEFRLIKTNDELEDLSITMHEMAIDLISKEKRLSNILESIPYAVITTNKLGNIVTFNKGAENLTLYKRNEVKGKPIMDLYIMEKDNENKQHFITWQSLEKERELHELDGYIINKERKRIDVRVYSSGPLTKEQLNVGMIVILRDVSEIKKLEDNLKQSERLSSLGQLTAGIAHEIKNPLSIIQAAAEAIQLEVSDDKFDQELIKELSSDILETTDRLNLLLTDFLNMSTEERSDKKEVVNLASTVTELLTLLRKKLEEQHITVYPSFKEIDQYDVNVYVNQSKLIQVILNIFINSLQAMENGGTLYIDIHDKGADWELVVRDTGSGIPLAEMKWIFNPFYTTKKEGTGLGLSIAYEIIKQSNGNIRAESTLGEGTSIYINLPKYKLEGGEGNEFYIVSR